MVNPAISTRCQSQGGYSLWREWRNSWSSVSNPKEPQLWPAHDNSTSSSVPEQTKPMPDVRSRTGCLACRRRRRKCDEVRPICGACQKRQLACEYTTRVRWTPAKIPGAILKTWPQPETEEQQASSPAAAPDTQNPDSEQRSGRPDDSKYASRELPFLGILHVGDSINYVSDDQPQDADDNMNDAEENGGSAQPDRWKLENFVELLNTEQFSSAVEVNAFAYCKSKYENMYDYLPIAHHSGIRYMSTVLPVYHSAATPFENLSKLALASPVLLSTIISLATEYLYNYAQAGPGLTFQRHDQAINSFREALINTTSPSSQTANGSDEELSPKQATLVAVLLQVASTVFVGCSGADVNLVCAMHFLHDLDYINNPVEGLVPHLLVQRFAMFDVLSAIMRHRRPHLPSTFWLFNTDDQLGRIQPSFREVTGFPQPLLVFFSRLSNLAVDLHDGSTTESEVLSEALNLETDMRVYARSQLALDINGTKPSNQLDSLNQCFYWSAQLTLQRMIYRDATNSPRVQQTVKNIIDLMRLVPVGSGPDAALPFPLYISSKEAVTSEHREWVRDRIQQMKQIYPGRGRDALLALLEDIWKFIDEGQKDCDLNIRDMERRRDFCLF